MVLDPPVAAEDRLKAFNAVLDADLGHLDVDDLLGALLDRVVEILEADTAAVLLLEEASQQLVARAARGVEEEVRQGVRVGMGTGFAGRIAETRRPVVLDRVDQTTVTNPILWEKGIRSMLGVPLESGKHLLGVIHVGTFSGRPFTEEDASLLELVANRVAAAVQARELEIERTASRVLQRSLLPTALPRCPGIRFATRYVPAEVGGVGGDWYDAFLLPSGELWVMAGDVAGHGLEAAVVMGRLRSTLRSYALEGSDPDRVLRLADRKLQFFEPGMTATVLCMVLRPPYEEAWISSAGHLPPVLASPGRAATLVELDVSPPLGIDPTRIDDVSRLGLPPGSVLVAYTDGLVERRGESLDTGFDRLVRVVRPVEPEQVCREVMDSLVGASIPQDDIAVVAFQRLPAG